MGDFGFLFLQSLAYFILGVSIFICIIWLFCGSDEVEPNVPDSEEEVRVKRLTFSGKLQFE